MSFEEFKNLKIDDVVIFNKAASEYFGKKALVKTLPHLPSGRVYLEFIDTEKPYKGFFSFYAIIKES